MRVVNYSAMLARARTVDAESEKLAKSAVKYSPSTGKDRCDGCEHFDAGTCALVHGEIEPDYWCEKFQPRKETP